MQRGHIRSRDGRRGPSGTSSSRTSSAGRRVVILGIGSIGSAIADRLRPFGVDIVGVGRTAREGVRALADLDELLPTADILVGMLPLTQRDDRGCSTPAGWRCCRDGALVVNAGRGRTVDTEALAAELQSGRLRAALDVVDPEPLPKDHPLWALPNVLITPHMAGDSPSNDDPLLRAGRRPDPPLRRRASR